MSKVDDAYKVGQKIAWEGSAVLPVDLMSDDCWNAMMAGWREAKEDMRKCPVCDHVMHKSALEDVVWNIYMSYCPECNTAHYHDQFEMED